MNKSINTFEETLNRRIKSCIHSWIKAEEEYFNKDQFIININHLLQDLRNLTFIIQSFKSCIPDFDSWYLPHQDALKNDDICKWSVESRNRVVKQEDLKLRSILKVGILTWDEIKLYEFELEALTDNEKIPILISSKVKKFLDQCRDPVIKLTRVWIADTLLDYELLYACSHCFNKLMLVIKSLYELLNLEYPKLLSESEAVHVLNSALKASDRVVYYSYTKSKSFSYRTEMMRLNEDLKKKSKELLGDPKVSKEDSTLDTFCKIAVNILTKMADHGQFAWIFPENKAPEFIQFNKEVTREEQYAQQDKILELVKAYEATSIIYCFDAIFKDTSLEESIEKEIEQLIFIYLDHHNKNEARMIRYKKLNDGSNIVCEAQKIELPINFMHSRIIEYWKTNSQA